MTRNYVEDVLNILSAWLIWWVFLTFGCEYIMLEGAKCKLLIKLFKYVYCKMVEKRLTI